MRRLHGEFTRPGLVVISLGGSIESV